MTSANSKALDSTRRIRLVRGDETEKERWGRCVKEAKLLLVKRDAAKIRICELCMEACGTIDWGGGSHWSNFDGKTTVSKFAYDIDMNPKTLLEWMLVKRYVYDKLNVKYQKNVNWSALAKIKNNLKLSRENQLEKTDINSLYVELVEQRNPNKDRVSTMIKNLNTFEYNIDAITKVSIDDMLELEKVWHSVKKKMKEKFKL